MPGGPVREAVVKVYTRSSCLGVLTLVALVLGVGFSLGALAPRGADAQASHLNSAPSRPHTVPRRPSKTELQKAFNRRYARCLRSSRASAALGLMGFVTRYGKRLKVNQASPKVKKCARFELRFDTHVTTSATGYPLATDETLQAVARLRFIGIVSSDFLFRASGPFEFKQYTYSANIDGCIGTAGRTQGATFKVLYGEIYTGDPSDDGFGDVTRLMYDPGVPLNYAKLTCDPNPPADTTWAAVWAQDHKDELVNLSANIVDGPWYLRNELTRHRGDSPQTLVRHEWDFTYMDPGESDTEATTLTIVRVK